MNALLLKFEPSLAVRMVLSAQGSPIELEYHSANFHTEGYALVKKHGAQLVQMPQWNDLKDQVAITVLEDNGDYSDVVEEFTFAELLEAQFDAVNDCWRLADGRELQVFVETMVKP